jgi:hypothetical protein
VQDLYRLLAKYADFNCDDQVPEASSHLLNEVGDNSLLFGKKGDLDSERDRPRRT